MKFSEYQNLKESLRRDPLFQDDTLLTEQEINKIVKYERLNESDDGLNLSKMFTWAAILGAGYLTWSKIKNYRRMKKALKVLVPLVTQEFDVKSKAALAIGNKKLEKDKLEKIKDADKVKRKKELIDQQIKNIEEKRDAMIEKLNGEQEDAAAKYEVTGKAKERLTMAVRNARLAGRENLANAELEYAQTAAQQDAASQKLEKIKKDQTEFSKSFNDVLVKDKDAEGKEVQLKSLDNSSELEEAKTELSDWAASLTELKDKATEVKADIAEYKKEKKSQEELSSTQELATIQGDIDEHNEIIDKLRSVIKEYNEKNQK